MSNSTNEAYLITDFVLGIINFAASSFIIFTFIAWKAGRKTPGDIILALALSSFLLSIYWITFPIYYFANNTESALSADSFFCQSFGFIQSLGFSGQFVYNFAYCFTLRQAITNVIKMNSKFKLLTHLVCVGLAFTAPIYMLISGNIGIVFGLCTTEPDSLQIFLEILLQFIYIISALYTIWYFYQNIPNDENLKEFKSKLLVRYVIYIFSTVVMLLFIAFSSIAYGIIYKGQINDPEPASDKIQYGEIFELIGNLASTAGPCILCYVRLKNPQISKKLRKLVQSTLMQNDEKLEIEIPETDATQKDSSADPQFTDLQRNIRIFQIRTILNGIVYYYDQIHKNYAERKCSGSEFSSEFPSSKSSVSDAHNDPQEQLIFSKLDEEEQKIFYTLKKFGLSNELLNKECKFSVSARPGEVSEKIAKKNMTLYPKMYALAPKFFQVLLYLDKVEVDAADSFSPEKNAAQIESMVGPDGGKSGEFFFFTYDNKWILKTLSENELMAFRKIFPEYIHHMETNPFSLINKIYGVFSIDMNQMQTQLSKENSIYHMVLMRNLGQVPRGFINRIFDLKGSEVAREVLKGKSQSSVDLTKVTLKDKDFENTEYRIYLPDDKMIKIHDALVADAKFFQKQELMDYSLLIMKVDWKAFQEAHSEGRSEERRKTFHDLQVVPVEGDALGHYYHFAIIDYFQEWNLKKQTEKTTKQIIALNPHLDTSAQNPDKYAERFISNVVDKLFQVRSFSSD